MQAPSQPPFMFPSFDDAGRWKPRISMACVNCRKRKVKCITTEDPPQRPCERCAKRGLQCEYVPVSESPTTPYYPTTIPIPPAPGTDPGHRITYIQPRPNQPPSPPRPVPNIANATRGGGHSHLQQGTYPQPDAQHGNDSDPRRMQGYPTPPHSGSAFPSQRYQGQTGYPPGTPGYPGYPNLPPNVNPNDPYYQQYYGSNHGGGLSGENVYYGQSSHYQRSCACQGPQCICGNRR